MMSVGPKFGLAHMDPYRLFLYREDGQVVAPAIRVRAANDAEAIAKAEAMHRVEGLRIVRYLPGNGEASSEAAESRNLGLRPG
jgi:hypothetical protein